MFVGVTSHIDFPTLTAWLEFAFAVPVRFELAAGIVTSPAVHPPITVDAIPYMRAVQDLKNWVDVVTSEFDADPPGYCPLIFDQDMERTAAGLWTVAAVGMASGIGEWEVALVATGVAVVVLYVVGVVQWLFRGRRSDATTVLNMRVVDPQQVEEAARQAAALVKPYGEVAIHEISAERAVIQVTVDPESADAVMVRLRSMPGVEKVTRVDG